MRKDYDYVYAIIRADEYQGPDCPIEHKVTVKEIVQDEQEAAQEVARLNGLSKEGVRYFSQATRLIITPSLPGTPACLVVPQGSQIELVKPRFANQPFGYADQNGHRVF